MPGGFTLAADHERNLARAELSSRVESIEEQAQRAITEEVARERETFRKYEEATTQQANLIFQQERAANEALRASLAQTEDQVSNLG